jgi:hypothetical protein
MDKHYLCRINLKSMSEFIAGNKVRAKFINRLYMDYISQFIDCKTYKD